MSEQEPRRFPPWVALLALVPALLAGPAAHLPGALRAAPGEAYLGFPGNVVDRAAYMALARRAAEGEGLALTNPFIAEPQSGRIVVLPLLLVAGVSRATGLALESAYLLAGTLVGWGFFLVCWWALGSLVSRPGARAAAFLLICLADGLQWIPGLLGLPLEDARARWSTWSSALDLSTPGFAALLAALVGSLRLCAAPLGAAGRPAQVGWAVFTLAMLAASFFAHPYTGLGGLALVGAFAVEAPLLAAWRGGALDGDEVRRRARLLAPLAAQGLIVLLYAAWARSDPAWAETSRLLSAWTPGGAVAWYPLYYGVPFGLALLGVRAVARGPTRAQRLVLTWVLVATALSVFPFLPGVKFLHLLHPPLCVLAAEGALSLGGRTWARSRRATPLVAALAVGCFGGTALAAARALALRPSDPLAYAREDQLELLAALDRLPAGNVLGSPGGCLLVPWKSGKNVYLGHWFLSSDAFARRRRVEAFFAPDADEGARRLLLEEARIRYVVEDPWTRARGPLAPELVGRVAFSNAFGRIVEVRQEPGPVTPSRRQ